MVDELTILRDFHKQIVDSYDWLNDPNGAERKVQYILGLTDMTSNIIDRCKFTETMKENMLNEQ